MPILLQRLVWLLLGLFTHGQAKAADNFIVGVGTHLLHSTAPVARPTLLMSEAGIVSARDDLFWSTAEPEPKRLYVPLGWQRYLQALRNRQIGNMLILGYGNQWYENGAKPRSPFVRDAFANYVNFISRRLRGQVDFYEVWNEWDLEDPTGEVFSRDYATLIKDTSALLRSNDPNVRVLAGAVTTQGLQEGFADRLVQAGVMDDLDGLSLHPYVHCRKDNAGNTPENWIKWLSEISTRLDGLAQRPVPLYLTEMSWPSADEPCGVSETTQAAYLARGFFLARIHPAIQGMWWYDLFNDGRDPKEREHNFGLLDNDLNPKPAYTTLKAIAPYLSQYSYDPKHSVVSDTLYQLRFAKGDEQVLVMWAVGQSRPVRIESSALLKGGARLIDTRQAGVGIRESENPWDCGEHYCTTVVTASEFPKIISLGKANWLFTQ